MKSSDNLPNKSNKTKKNAHKKSEKSTLPWEELLSDVFMKQYSPYENLNQFLEASGFKIENAEDFQQIPEDKWNEFIKASTTFNSWEDMLGTATKSWIKKKLGF